MANWDQTEISAVTIPHKKTLKYSWLRYTDASVAQTITSPR